MIMYYLSIQCQGHVITEDYMDFPKAACPGVSEPCWIPQIQSILPTAIISRLSQCDSMEKYKCMLLTVMYSRKNVKRRCKKSCKAENYKIISRTGTIEPFTKVTHLQSLMSRLKLNAIRLQKDKYFDPNYCPLKI